MINDKIVSRGAAREMVEDWQQSGQTVVFTNGCFDLLHAGHVRYLEAARALGNRLVVAVNDDTSVKALKGEGRPIQPAAERTVILAALESVDLVVTFSEERTVNILNELRPDLLVKGGDYDLSSLFPAEREAVQAYGGKIAFIPLMGPSTTELIGRIRGK
jgi:rfaE bifunctional protein nucleotidyltransferase chain/domain